MARRAYSLDQLRVEINTKFPNRDIRSDGWIGDAAHQDRPSDHNPNDKGVVQAIDVDEHTDQTERSDAVARWLWDKLLASRDPRIKYVIYEERMFSSYPTSHRGLAWTVGPGSGHLQHLHISVVDDPRKYDDRSPWFQQEDTVAEWKNANVEAAVARLRQKGIYTAHTPPGDVVETDQLAIYLDATTKWLEQQLAAGGAGDAPEGHTHTATVKLT